MGLKDRLVEEMKEAAKSGDKLKLSIIRMALAAIKNKEKELRREPDDQEVMKLLASMIKQGKEAREQFSKGGREDLAEKEAKEVEILQSFLPPPLSPQELEEEVRKAIEEVGAKGPQDLGRVMKVIMPRIAGRAEGRSVNELVRKKLSELATA
ncbi:MAG: GatB/YqeY domain-containing protein [Deltaproteobacteria bacterium]|nr:MAG: GatB/YqeY domain-containing protein [Deltaproteobacteria bacterium]